jgi:hypothetical protein
VCPECGGRWDATGFHALPKPLPKRLPPTEPQVNDARRDRRDPRDYEDLMPTPTDVMLAGCLGDRLLIVLTVVPLAMWAFAGLIRLGRRLARRRGLQRS